MKIIQNFKMNKYFKANKEKIIIDQSYDIEHLDIKTYVKEMRLFNKNMFNIEKEMLKEYDDMSIALVTSDKNNSVLQKRNKELANKLLLTEKKAENETKYHNKIIKKDKYINTLKQSIKTRFLNFGEDMMPKIYMRISQRFPHLTIQEVIDFEKKVRANGGSIQVHVGYWKVTDRTHRPDSFDTVTENINSWNCCGPYYNKFDKNYTSHRGKKQKPGVDGQYTNRDPSSTCCRTITGTFYLKEEDQQKIDISQVKVSDVTKSVLHNIKVLENTVEEYSEKIKKLKSLRENIDLLKDI
jgi:hypothetical protein